MTHIDEARRIVKAWGANMNASWDRPIADIAAALAAAERAGIEMAANEADSCDEHALAGQIRALLPAAVAEPAAKCEKCLGSKIVCRNAMCPGGGSCCIPCPARAAGGGS